LASVKGDNIVLCVFSHCIVFIAVYCLRRRWTSLDVWHLAMNSTVWIVQSIKSPLHFTPFSPELFSRMLICHDVIFFTLLT